MSLLISQQVGTYIEFQQLSFYSKANVFTIHILYYLIEHIM